jgi:kumamolisin
MAAAAYYVATGKPANIRVYWSQNIETAVTAAAKDSCSCCSISWGADENSWGTEIQAMEAAAQAAVNAGMIVFAASGDNDSSDGGSGAANVDAPASCPSVVGCGGTRKEGIAFSPSMETVWNDDPGTTNGEGTGGGYSTVFPVQSWQIGAPPAPAGTNGKGRMVPDVTANADPVTGYNLICYGVDVIIGGTSAVAPLYAGLFAAFGTKLGFVTPRLWSNRDCFNDITVGNNGEFSAEKGPDPCSGIGSPIGIKLALLFDKK